jgi:hypothetical protein
MKTLNWGIETETVGANKLALANAIQSVVGGQISGDTEGCSVNDRIGRVWQVVSDSSLAGTDNGEVVSPILGYADMDELQRVVRALRAAGARPHSSAGIHIHVSVETLSAAAIANLVKSVAKNEKLIEQALRIQPGRLARYCQPIDEAFLKRIENKRPKTMAELQTAWYNSPTERPSRYHMSRYYGLNVNAALYRGAIEWRLFESTLHAGEFAYVTFCPQCAPSRKQSGQRLKPADSQGSKYQMRCSHSLGLTAGIQSSSIALRHLAGSAA